jgi:hypothetical protein
MKAHFGRQSLFLEEGNVLSFQLAGEVTEQELAGCMAAIEEWTEGYTYLLMLIDVRELDIISPGARRLASRKPAPPGQYQAFACIGASFRTRVVLGLVIKAMRLLKATRFDLEFFTDEADARAWLTGLRDRYASG